MKCCCAVYVLCKKKKRKWGIHDSEESAVSAVCVDLITPRVLLFCLVLLRPTPFPFLSFFGLGAGGRGDEHGFPAARGAAGSSDGDPPRARPNHQPRSSPLRCYPFRFPADSDRNGLDFDALETLICAFYICYNEPVIIISNDAMESLIDRDDSRVGIDHLERTDCPYW